MQHYFLITKEISSKGLKAFTDIISFILITSLCCLLVTHMMIVTRRPCSTSQYSHGARVARGNFTLPKVWQKLSSIPP